MTCFRKGNGACTDQCVSLVSTALEILSLCIVKNVMKGHELIATTTIVNFLHLQVRGDCCGCEKNYLSHTFQ